MIKKTEEPPPISMVEFQRRLKLSKKQFARLDALLKSSQRDTAANRKKMRRLVAELDKNLWRGHLYYRSGGKTVRAQLAKLETVLNQPNN